MDENLSWYLDENIKKFTSQEVDPYGEEFMESNKMHGSVESASVSPSAANDIQLERS